MRARRCPRTCFVDDEAPRRLGRQRRIAVEAPSDHRGASRTLRRTTGYTVASGARAETERAAYEQARRVCAARLPSAPSADPQDPPPGEGVGLSGWLSRRGNEWRSRSGHGPQAARGERPPRNQPQRPERRPLPPTRLPRADRRQTTHLRRSEVIGASRAWPKEERPLWRRLAREADGLLSTQHGRPDASPLCPKPDARPTLGDEGSRDPGCCHRTLHRSPAGSHRSYVAW